MATSMHSNLDRLEFKETQHSYTTCHSRIRIQTDWNLKENKIEEIPTIHNDSNLDRLEFKVNFFLLDKDVHLIRIQTDWNLKADNSCATAVELNIRIQTDWNLKRVQGRKRQLKEVYSNLDRLEFKVQK